MSREMKDSGFSWIGEVPNSWKVVPVKVAFSEIKTRNSDGAITNALKFKFGEIVPKSNFDSETDDYVADTILNYTVVEPKTIMINGLNLNYDFKTLRTGLVKEKGIITSAYLALKPDENIIWAEYATYLFKGYETKMAFHNMGSGIRLTLGFKEFKNQPLLLPALPEQKAIAAFLDTKCSEIDAVIAKTKATIEEYKKLKQSIITEAVTKGIRGDRPMKDSGIEWIGGIPADWNRNSIKNVATTCSGGTPNSSDETLYDGEINWICSYDLKEKPIYESGRKITQKGADAIAGKLQSVGSILVAMYGGAGTIGNSGILECEARTNQAICSIKFTNDHILDYYGFYYILSIRKYWMIYAVGTRKDPNISQDIVKNMPCIIPPIDEQKEIVEFLDKKCSEMDVLIEKKTVLLEEMETYKKSVIYEYVTGKKEVER